MRKTPRQQRSSFTVEMILEAATQLLDAEGAGLTTNGIAERAGVSVGSIYQYFGDKQAVFDELARRHLESAGARLTTILDDNPVGSRPWPEILRLVIGAAVQENSTHGRAHGRLRELTDPVRLATGYTALVDTLIGRLLPYLVADGWTPESGRRRPASRVRRRRRAGPSAGGVGVHRGRTGRSHRDLHAERAAQQLRPDASREFTCRDGDSPSCVRGPAEGRPGSGAGDGR
ncbi:TetR/AcrR family transcriptional regulator [Gordonia sp. 'Campus']|uniref:TetR/AcrR family transcriptional regulator n=1 Tax=Gordonia sp. 'Campus' TaxID=2915824 RepID=UPI001EE4103A|nr:TetR/AcrR family transcriptional regulator [Gordonia sp. 'Campus']